MFIKHFTFIFRKISSELWLFFVAVVFPNAGFYWATQSLKTDNIHKSCCLKTI